MKLPRDWSHFLVTDKTFDFTNVLLWHCSVFLLPIMPLIRESSGKNDKIRGGAMMMIRLDLRKIH